MIRSLIQNTKRHYNKSTIFYHIKNTHESTQTILDNGNTHFGYQEVPKSEKPNLVKEVFSKVASKYDLMNDVMSIGIHRVCKNTLINQIMPYSESKLLDVAGGTGDITFRYCDRFKSLYPNNDPNVTILDINENMIEEGRNRIKKSTYHNNVNFVVDDAHLLGQIESNSVDIYTIAFGIRNCTEIYKVLEAAYRVLKPGGTFNCLEFSIPPNQTFNTLYELYSMYVIPQMGQLIANDYGSYKYLVESIRKFPTQKVFANMIKEAGFYVVGDGYESLSLGIAAIHRGYKI